MESHRISDRALAATITRTASKHTYYTIRCLVDTGLVQDAYRAYAYFRWVDDWLDQEPRPRTERLAFVKRQQALIDGCAHRDLLDDLTPEECLLADLIQRDTQKKILIGHKGEMIKRIGTEARKELEKLLDAKIYLGLHVKVVPDWRESPQRVRELDWRFQLEGLSSGPAEDE